MHWDVAEQAACDWMRTHGFPDARLTGVGSDEGVDATSAGAIAQVKHWNKPVGRPALQNLRGAAMHGQALLFFATAGYTPQADSFASQVGMALFTFDGVLTVLPVNEAARRITGETPGPPTSAGPFRPDPGRTHREQGKDLEAWVKARTVFGSRPPTKLIRAVPSHLKPTEEVRVAARLSHALRSTQLLVVTNTRLLVLTGVMAARSYPLRNLAGLEYRRDSFRFVFRGERVKAATLTERDLAAVRQALGG